MVDINIVLCFLSFFIGMLFHKISSDLIGMGHVALFLRVIEIQALKMLQVVGEDVEFIHTIKTKLLKDLNTPEEEMRFIKSIDERTLGTWKEEVIAHFIAAYPGKYRHQLEFTDWRGAMRQLKYVENHQKNKKQFN